ncbi:MAG: hypothetical protein RR626_08690 [Anaerovoracaceae bacterium]
MKFITEDDLRVLYRNTPFTTYEIAKETRLTPGAKQFLTDRRVEIIEGGQEPTKEEEKEKPEFIPNKLSNKKICAEIKATEAEFLLAAESFSRQDLCRTRRLLELGNKLAELIGFFKDAVLPTELACKVCTGMTCENFSTDLGDCFTIEEFHVTSSKGKEILELNKLKCGLRKLEIEILEYAEKEAVPEMAVDRLLAVIYQVINALSQMTCEGLGGNQCQREK